MHVHAHKAGLESWLGGPYGPEPSPDLVSRVHVHYLQCQLFWSPQMADSQTATQKLIMKNINGGGAVRGKRHPWRALTTEVYSKGPEGSSVEGKLRV